MTRAQHKKRFRAVPFNQEVDMETREFMPWEELYVAAVLEVDPKKAAERINVAQDALRERQQALDRGAPLARNPERIRVADAIQTLNLIKRNELGSPG